MEPENDAPFDEERGDARSETMETPDFRTLFESSPGIYLVLTPALVIAAATDAYLAATFTRRDEILGRSLFDVFPDNPDDPTADGVRNLTASLRRVLETRAPDTLPIQRYDIARPESHGGGFEERYWSPTNMPVLGKDGAVRYILHRVEDVTAYVQLQSKLSADVRERQALLAAVEEMRAEVFLARELQRAGAKLREADEERVRLLRQTAEAAIRQRLFLRDVLYSVSEGKLRLCDDDDDLPGALSATGEPVPLTPQTLNLLRRESQRVADANGFPPDRTQDLTTAVGEAAMNAIVHAGGGIGQVYIGDKQTIQVWIVDVGAGIAVSTLHRATLERGFTTAGSLGHGFCMMLRSADRVWLRTGATGTTVVIEQDRAEPEPAWLAERL